MGVMSYANAGEPAPAPGSPKGWGWFKGILDFVFGTYNAHINNAAPADQHLSNAILASDANRPLTTIRALNGNTLFTETDMTRRMWLELVDADYNPANFAGKVVPINLLTARNNIRSGLGTGDGTGIPGTTAPNVNPSTIPWRDASGFIASVIGSIPHQAIQELLVRSTGPASAAVLINAGAYVEAGTGTYRAYGGGTISTLAAPGTGLERYDAVYLIANPSGLVIAAITQGVAATIGSASAQVPIPDGGCLLAILYMNGTTSVVSNSTTIAGGFAPGGNSYILDARVLRGGGTPVDASLSMTKIKEFAPRPTTPPSLFVVVNGGGYFTGSMAPVKYGGSSFAYNGAANAAVVGGVNPSLPAAGFARFDGISVDPTTNLLTITPGVPSNSGAEFEPSLPTSGRPSGYVHVTSTTTAIYSSFTAMFTATGGTTQGWIDDSYRVGAGGGASGSSISSLAPSKIFANNDATYQDAFLGPSAVVSANLPSMIQPTGSGVQIIATQANPVKVSFNGVERRYPDPATPTPPYLSTTAIGTGLANASGAAGFRYLVADKSTAGVKIFGITIMTVLPSSTDQALLATLWWDGSNLVTIPDLGPILSVNSALVDKRGTQVYWQGQTNLNSTSLIVPATMPTSAPFIVPPNTRLKFKVRVKGLYNPGATPAAAIFQSWLLLDGVTQIKGTQVDNTGYSAVTANTPLRETIEYELLAGPSSLITPGQAPTDVAVLPGQHTVTWGYIVSGTATFDAYVVQIQVDIMRAGGN